MMIRWNELDNAFSMLNEFRRELGRWGVESPGTYGNDYARTGQWTRGWPRMDFTDGAKELTLRAEVPGLGQDDFEISVNQEVLTISGQRETPAPEGYKVHRRERASVKFTRSFALPSKVDLEKTTAVVKNGVLTVRLPKAPESQPRQIAVKAR